MSRRRRFLYPPECQSADITGIEIYPLIETSKGGKVNGCFFPLGCKVIHVEGSTEVIRSRARPDAGSAVDNHASFTINYLKILDTEFTTAYIGLGSNLGDRAGNLLLAVRGLMEASFDVCKLSAIYETEPWQIDVDTWFLNMVAEVKVSQLISPSQMMARLLRIEYLLGRGAEHRNTARTADLDMLFFGDMKVESELLKVPHPRLHLRRFVLCPLAEIAPNFHHPLFGRNITDLLAACPDQSEVNRWHPKARTDRDGTKS
jgi:2-amino-4-hydroxy-6-hydroxymethyldihydropteridine diphosphokinase